MNLQKFLKVRPFLYHLTARSNAERLRSEPVIYSTASLAREVPDLGTPAVRRTSNAEIAGVLVRDQAPLHVGNIEFTGGADFSDLLRLLNERVFFWPGDAERPVAYGARHFQRYEAEKPVVIRVPTAETVRLNASRAPELCRYNSGSPRCSGGKKSPRGFDTFIPVSQYSGTPGSVVEVTFVDMVRLPQEAEYGTLVAGKWQACI